MAGRQDHDGGAKPDRIPEGSDPLVELNDKHVMASELREALGRYGLATWGGKGSVEDVAALLHERGWRRRAP
jgi:hypothetical protein